MSDGRPLRVEFWRWKGFTVLTFFMSTHEMEQASDEDFRDLLEDEGILTFETPDPVLVAHKIRDGSGNEMWSVNVAVGDRDELFVRETLSMTRYGRVE
jgi:hypothetical protein